MDGQNAGSTIRSGLQGSALSVIDRFHNVSQIDEKLRARVAISLALQGILVAIPGLVTSLASGRIATAVSLSIFVACIALLLAASRLGAPVSVTYWTLLSALGGYLVADSLTVRELQPEQVSWLVLLPLTTFMIYRPRPGVDESRAFRPPLIATLGAVAAGVFMIVAHDVGLTLDYGAGIYPTWARTLNFVLFVAATSSLILLYALSVQESETELSQLRSLLAICAWCRKIRDEETWVPFEIYLEKHQRQDLTHGICPSCLAKVSGEFHSSAR